METTAVSESKDLEIKNESMICGDPKIIITDKLKERFLNKVEMVSESGCWIWMGKCNDRGYGLLRINKKAVRAHRVSWTIHNGKIPLPLCVLHSCDTPLCVNPTHLFLGTQADNVADRDKKHRREGLKGEDNNMAKLKKEDILKIRADHRSLLAIAKDYGMTISPISAIKNYKTWRHIA